MRCSAFLETISAFQPTGLMDTWVTQVTCPIAGSVSEVWHAWELAQAGAQEGVRHLAIG